MAVKTIDVPQLGTVKLYKRRGTRVIRLSVGSSGEIRVTMPPWTPYRVGLEFASANRAWVSQHARPGSQLNHLDQIGKAHRLYFVSTPSQILSTRVVDSSVRVRVPQGMAHNEPQVQQAASRAARRALKIQAGHLLPPRLARLAVENNFTYRSVRIKHLKSRWGSCSSEGDIALNSYLMRLPWELIDYVLLHELLHTRVMAHGPRFWSALAAYVPDLPIKRHAMRKHRPTLTSEMLVA